MTHLINSQLTGDQFPTSSIIIAIESGAIQNNQSLPSGSHRQQLYWGIVVSTFTAPRMQTAAALKKVL